MNAKLIKRILIAGLALVGLVSVEAFAQVGPNATVTVSATVNASCRFQTLTGSMTLANTGSVIDPALGTDATGNTTLTYRCTNGSLPEFDIDGSGTHADPKTRTVTLTGAGNLDASITVTGGGAGLGMGAAGNRTATVAGTITAANIDNATPGSYSKDVVINILAQ
ncbi:MAG TPA: hypothetical protein VD839_14750 [Burkholderiales bacterium]|jgi:hypothetical protein|nr:hypothetical protein [Burkholderiales bacterium]